MAQVTQNPTHWYDFLPVWWSVIAGAATALFGGIIRVERIASAQSQNIKDTAELKAEVKEIREAIKDIPVMKNDTAWIRDHLERRG